MTTESLLDGNPPISDELYTSVKEQVITKVMTYFRVPIDPTIAVSLYANSVDGMQRIKSSHTNKDGTDNNNPMNYGNTYEEQEVTAFNHAAIENNCDLRAERTDNLSKMKDLPKPLQKYANLHDQHSDIIIYDNNTGEVVARVQLKHTKDTTILTKEAYTTSREAPEIILVPPDTEARHAVNLRKRMTHGRSENSRNRAEVASEKLTGGLVDSKYTEKIDDDNPALNDTFSIYGQLHKLSKDYPSLSKKIPYAGQAGTLITDAASNVTNSIIAGAGPIILGGIIYELKDAFENQNSLSWIDRICRFLNAVFSSIKNTLKNSLVKELINGILGFVAGIFKNAAKLITTFATAIHQICGHIYDYVTGKIKNFSDLVAVVLKAFAVAGITTFCVILEKFVATNFPWIPGLLVAILSAAIGGIAMVFASKAIDAVVYTFVKMVSRVEAAKLRREQIEKYINDTLPKLLESSNELDAYIKDFTANQEKILQFSYPEIAKNFSDDTCTAKEFVEKLNDIHSTLGMQRFPDDYVDKVHNKLLRDSDIINNRIRKI